MTGLWLCCDRAMTVDADAVGVASTPMTACRQSSTCPRRRPFHATCGVALALVMVGAFSLTGCSRSSAAPATTVDPIVTWCALAVEMTTFADEQASATGTAGGDERQALDRLQELLNKGRDIAPPEIAADVALAADRVEQVADLLASVGYDDALLSDDLLAQYESAGQELAQASAVITDFNQRYCGVGTDNPGRDQAIAELVRSGFSDAEANCLYDAIAGATVTPPDTPADDNTQANPQQEMEALFAGCGIDLDRLADWLAENPLPGATP